MAKKEPIVLAAVLTIASLVPVWSVTYFPSQNGPWYLLTVKMFRDFHDPDFNYAEYYRLSWHVIPYLLHNAIVYIASLFTTILIAHKIAVSVYVVLFPLGIFYFLSTVAPQRWIWGFLSYLLIFNYPLFRGYQNFALAIPFFFFAFGYWIRHKDQLTRFRLLTLNLLVFLVFLAHIIVFGLLAISMSVWAVAESRKWTSVFRTYLVAFIPSSIFFADFVLLNVTSSHWLGEEGIRYLPLHWKAEYFLTQTFYPIVTFDLPWGLMLATAPFLVVAWTMIRAIISVIGKRRFGEPQAKEPRLMLAVLATLIALFWLMPYEIGGWHHANMRIGPFVVIIAVAFVASLSPPTYPRLFLAGVATASLALFALLTFEIRTLDAAVIEYVSSLEKLERNKVILPLMAADANTRFGQIRPLTRAHEYYHIAKGGANGVGVARFNTIVPVWYRTYPVKSVFPSFRADKPDESARKIAETYDYVVVWGRSERHDDLVQRLESLGFFVLHREGEMRVFGNGARQKSGVLSTSDQNRDENQSIKSDNVSRLPGA